MVGTTPGADEPRRRGRAPAPRLIGGSKPVLDLGEGQRGDVVGVHGCPSVREYTRAGQIA